ncbi:FIVAR domain-containing protein [[Mycoplasma] imitans]|uniref:FIVAR domain-containing protein n=1 Tax=[Mycoplasma] imitans TaxID=29560 RepID=UPI000486A1A1|nr:FIVAR domain-containing protein [[Mycoplasma] imitans]
MKKKSLFKIVSLVGLGSFAGLAPASCSALVRSVNQSGTFDTKPSEPNNNENGSGNGAVVNPSQPNETTTPTQPVILLQPGSATSVSQAKSQLSGLLGNQQATTLGMYDDYKTIQSTLQKAYDDANAVYSKPSATVKELTDATVALQNAISQAQAQKSSFNQTNANLLAAFNQIKQSLQLLQGINTSLTQTQYSAIKSHVNDLSQQATAFVKLGLQADNGLPINLANVTSISSQITEVTSKLAEWKQTADSFANFQKFALVKTNFSGGTATTQPSNFGFSAFSVPYNASYKYGKRVVRSGDGNTTAAAAGDLTDVAWIYNFDSATTDAYTFTFNYYGPSNAWLYFPFKLANTTTGRVSFAYQLNDRNAAIERTVKINAPTVDSIQVAKVPLDDLKFGQNKISFSAVSEATAPMVGNFFISSSNNNDDAVYNAIFGNSYSEDMNSVSVDFLSGYGLANNSETMIRQLTAGIDGATGTSKYNIIGWLGGTVNSSAIVKPTNGDKRSYTFYVNAPKDGSYTISGYTYSLATRDLVFRTLPFPTGAQASTTVTISNITASATNSSIKVKKFDTKSMSSTTNALTLQKGLNRIVVTGGTADSGNAPNVGNLTFTFKA